MRLKVAVGIVLTAFLLPGCSGSKNPGQQTMQGVPVGEQIVDGFAGGCSEGFVIYVQNQYVPYGTMVRDDISKKGKSAGLRGNEKLIAYGWVEITRVLPPDDPDLVFYPENPHELQNYTWFYVRLPNGKLVWVPDSGVRKVQTEHAPDDNNEHFDAATQAPPLIPECELVPL